ncbi:MAG: N-6 DNA methylase [Gallionella sp.]|nr:N-6 DNA methylase [Gallionella sp.]
MTPGECPQHRELRFDAIVANPPFSAQWSASRLHRSDDRFSVYGKLAPSSKADMAFVQHMVYHLAEEGTMAVVLPHDKRCDHCSVLQRVRHCTAFCSGLIRCLVKPINKISSFTTLLTVKQLSRCMRAMAIYG